MFLNVKGIKSPNKRRLFWEDEVKENKVGGVWTIQKHHLNASSPRKQANGRKLVFYGQGIGRDNGVLMIVDKDLELVIVFNHPCN